jgi:ubiquinone/menaquinone biosynthesis C-methylase UbiE
MKPLVRLSVVWLVALTGALGVRPISAQDAGTEFEQQNRVADLVRLLAAQPGAMVAEVGAGDGAFTIPLARAVAPNGRAVAVDVNEAALTRLRDRAARENAGNVDIVLGAVDDPRLPAGQFDGILIHNAYHEMTAHEAMLRHIRDALKPGGRFVIVEPMHDSSRGLPRDKQVANHDIEPGIVEDELRAVGFEVFERDDGFIRFTAVPGGFWLIAARVK